MLRRISSLAEGFVSQTKVMVALRDVESVESLVTLACHLANGLAGDVIALHVVEVPAATPIEADDEVLDRPGKEIMEQARRIASQYCKRKLSTLLLRARTAGEALVDEVKEHGVELLVMGYHQPHRLGEVLLGSTVQYVARHAPCRVIVQIPQLRRR